MSYHICMHTSAQVITKQYGMKAGFWYPVSLIVWSKKACVEKKR